MIDYNKLQTRVASGRFTFPVVALVCLLLWLFTSSGWQEGVSMLACVLVAYLLTELNTTFTLIRTRTTLHVCCYICLLTLCLFLHPLHTDTFVPLLFLLAIFQIFGGYEAPQASVHAFHCFFFIGLGSFLFPQLVWYAPLFYLGMYSFRSLSLRSLLAGIVGLATPYWFLFGYALYADRLEVYSRPLQEMIAFAPISYGRLEAEQLVFGGIIVLFSVVSSICYLHTAYLDKVRTRLFLLFLVGVEVWSCLLGVLQPQHFNVLMQIQILICSIFMAHLFALNRSRFAGIFFIVTFVILIVWTVYNVWMQLFNF